MEMGHLLLVHVLDEVGLALELPGDLLGVHRRQRPLLGLCGEGGFHFSLFRNYRKTRRRDLDAKFNFAETCQTVRNGVSFWAQFDQKCSDGTPS